MAHSLEVRVPVPRSRRHEPRLRAADAAQGARAPEEGAAAEGGRAAPAARDHPREEARLLDSGRGVAARRARAVRARDALGRDAAAPGLLRAGAVTRLLDEHVAGGRLEPPALGAARVHALVRTAGRAGAAAPTIRPDGGARRMRDFRVRAGLPAHRVATQLVEAVLRGARRRRPGCRSTRRRARRRGAGARCALDDDEPVAIVEVTESRMPAARSTSSSRGRRRGLRVGRGLALRTSASSSEIEPDTLIEAVRFRVVSA